MVNKIAFQMKADRPRMFAFITFLCLWPKPWPRC